ncbi:MAG: hypothetical protein HUK02_01690, partial [Bacteroidaceae bacterium]|nr:hypothetical protein [Bacteroidaceae bacterium]
MKKTLLALFLLLTAATASAQMMLDTLGTVRYFTLTDGQMMAIPERYIIERTEDNRALSLKLAGDTTIVIQKRNIASESTDFHCDVPEITSFKFNNKFNDQLYADAIGTIDQTQSRIDVELSCIGQRLAPSIQKSEGAELYVNGIHQESKKSRQRFDNPVTYTVAYPKNWVYVYHQTSEEVWSQPDFRNPDVQWWFEDVPLNEWQVLTNAPSNFGEDPYYLLDDDPNTFFHSTWGNGDYTPLTWYEGATYGDGVSEWPYLGFYLYDEIKNFKFSYTLRNDIPGYGLLSFIVQGSNDGQAWEDIRTFTAERDGLPTEQGGSYESPIIGTRSYKYLKLQLTSSQKANYLVLSSFRLTKATINPQTELFDGITLAD